MTMKNIDSVYAAPASKLDKKSSHLLYENAKSQYRKLLFSFLLFPATLVIIFILSWLSIDVPKYIDIALLIMLILPVILYNVFLSICARAISSSSVKWVVLNLLFSPISYLITMYMMRNRMKNIIQDLEDATAFSN